MSRSSSERGVYRRPSRVYFRPRRRVPPGKAQQPGIAIETDTASALSFAKVSTIGTAIETSTAFALTVAKQFEIVEAIETWTAGALVGSTSPGGMLLPQLFVEVSFAVGAAASPYLTIGDPTRGIIGTGLIGSGGSINLGGVWTDITEFVISGTISRGSSRVDSPVVQYDSGTCSIVLDNSDRRFDQTNLAGPYVDNGVSQVTPMRGVRVRAMWNDVIYELFRGYADMWAISWDGPNRSECVLTASDAFKVLAGIKRAAVAAEGAGDDTGARVTRILDSVDWDVGDRMIDTGDVTLQATTLEGDALEELRLAVDSELGELYVDGGGRVTFRRRSAISEEQRSAISQASFDDEEEAFQYIDLAISNDDSTFYNKARITRVGGAEQSASDTSSITTFLERTFERSDLIMETDAQALTYANEIITRVSEPELRFDEITILPAVSPTMIWPHALGRELGDRITITKNPPGGGTPIVRDTWIRGIIHEWEPMRWQVKWPLQRALDGLGQAAQGATRATERQKRWHAARRVVRRSRRRSAAPPRWR